MCIFVAPAYITRRASLLGHILLICETELCINFTSSHFSDYYYLVHQGLARKWVPTTLYTPCMHAWAVGHQSKLMNPLVFASQ